MIQESIQQFKYTHQNSSETTQTLKMPICVHFFFVSSSLGFQTPGEEVFGPQKKEVFGRLGIMKSYETWDILKDSTGDRQISEASTLV